jgi:hypothetical protein
VVHSPIRFEGIVSQNFDSEFELVDRAVFEKPVVVVGQTVWSGGESDILESLHIGGPENNSFLENHILNNHGTVTFEKGPSTGLLFRNSDGRPVGIRNLAGATWMHMAGSLASSSSRAPSTFENQGLFIKSSTALGLIRLDEFVNLGAVEIREGTLQFERGSGSYIDQHLGSYRVDAGARLALLSRSVAYGRSTRIFGEGVLEIAGGSPDELLFPGSLEIGGEVHLLQGTLHFTGPVNSDAAWRLVGSARFSGLSPRIGGPVVIESRGALTVDSPSPLVIGGLTSSNEVTVSTVLQIDGPARFQGGSLRGAGRIRANGPVTFSGSVRETILPGTGRLEIAESAICESNTVVDLRSFGLSILPAAEFELAQARDLRFSLGAVVNDGTLSKTMPGNTRVLTGLENRGMVRITDGGVSFENGRVLQTAGVLSLSTTGLVLRTQSNQGPSGIMDLQGGRLEGGSVIYCGLLTNNAVVAPGLPIGILDLQVGNHPVFSVYHQTSAGRLQIELAGPESGVTHDVLNVSGRAVLDGTLEIVVAAGYDPPIGATYTILTAGRAVEGTFSEVLGAPLAGGKRLEVEYGPMTVSVRVAGSG